MTPSLVKRENDTQSTACADQVSDQISGLVARRWHPCCPFIPETSARLTGSYLEKLHRCLCARKGLDDRNWPTLSKKVFLAGEPNFSAPPARPMRVDVREHVDLQEDDHSASYPYGRGLQRRRQLKTDFREILGADQFSTFSTASAHSRSAPAGRHVRLLG